MPRRAKMTIKRKSNSSKDAIDCIEFNKEATKFDNDLQYLENPSIIECDERVTFRRYH